MTNDNSNDEARERSSRFFWVGLVCAMLSSHVLFLFVAVYVAVSDGSFAVEPDYYQKSLNWDATMAQIRDNERLGWQLQLTVADDANLYRERTIVCQLNNRDGQPLDGAIVDLVGFPRARGSNRTSVTLTPVGEGRYEGKVRFEDSGVWEFRLAVQRGPETFTHTQTLEVPK